MIGSKAVRGGMLAALAVTALTLSACGGGGGGGGESAERIYVQARGGDPMTLGLNAQFSSAPISLVFSSQLLEPLIFLSVEGELTPGLAESWEISEDGLDLTLQVREGVTWHDGEPFTAEDVKFNFDEIVPLQVDGAALAERIESVEITGDSTVVVHLSEPYGPLLETVATQFMLPKHIYEGTEYITNEANNKPIGTGPLMFDSYTSGKEVVLAAYPDYWKGDVQVDRVVYSVMPDANSRAEGLFADELDQAELDPSQQDRVAEDEDTQLLEDGNFPEFVPMIFNTENEYLDDPAVRKALYAALDREAIAENALSGVGTPAHGFFPETMDWALNPDVDFAEDFPHDLDAVNAALDEAGFERGPDGTRFTLRILYINPLSAVAATVEMVQSMLAEVGVETKLEGTSGATYVEKLYKQGDFDLAFVRSNVGPDPSLGIAPWYACNEDRLTGHNPTGVCDPEIDEAVATALSTTDREERGEAFKTMQARAAELMFYAPIAWYSGAFPTVNTSRWQGQDGPRLSPLRMPWLDMSLEE